MTLSVPQGFRLAGVHCGIKSNPNKEDVTLIVADETAVAAGVYTQNLVCAAPVVIDRQRTPTDAFRALIVNSGNANACTGEQGMRDAQEMTRLAAEVCGAAPEQALVMSTGIIGKHLPMDRIAHGIMAASKNLASDVDALQSAARGILTTDKGVKMAGRSLEIGGKRIAISGMAKGAGMIGPNMATLLGVVLTDAAMTPDVAQASLLSAVDTSFNCISVEGHTSTNDTVLLLASGAAGGPNLAGDDLVKFQATLKKTCVELAKQIPADGEGASHLIEIYVTGSQSDAGALQIAKTVADSALVKTAVAGGDPNWGRIVSAAGYAGVDFDPGQVDLSINGHLIYKQGSPVEVNAAEVSRSMKDNHQTDVQLRVGDGFGQCRFWTSDLTVEYVKFNADYHT